MKFFFLSFMLVWSTLRAQQPDDFVANDLDKTDFFNYKLIPYNYSYKQVDDTSYSIVTAIDSINYCRIKNNRIKEVRVYEFKNAHDSVLTQTINYATCHLDTIHMDCSNIRQHCIVKKKKTKVYDDFFRNKKIYRYDSLGYLTECSNYNRGILYKIWKAAIGLGNRRIYYQYTKDYTEVTVFISFSEWNNFESDVKKSKRYYVHTKNTNGDLLSVFEYSKSTSGDFQIVKGYKYIYEYGN